MTWVVDGLRLERDKGRFFKAFNEGVYIHAKPHIREIFIDECRLTKVWAGCRAPVVLDFGDSESPEEAALWCLLPWGQGTKGYLVGLSRAGFIHANRAAPDEPNDDFANFLMSVKRFVEQDIASRTRSLQTGRFLRQPYESGFQNHLRRVAARRRKRL
jgi:hypothetical protein